MWVFFSFIALKNLRIVEFFRSIEWFVYKILRWVALVRLGHNFQTYPDFLDRSRSINKNVINCKGLGYVCNVYYTMYIIKVGWFIYDYVFYHSNLGRGGRKGAVEKCSTCRGTGMQVHVRQLGPGMVQQIQSVCSDCKGQGERISAKDRCKTCAGAKTVRERKILEVHVDKGESGMESLW